MTTGSDERLSRVIAVINGKGGVGKTSITANLAGCMAFRGMRVLVVETDISGNLALDLGYITNEQNDFGKSIVQAVWAGEELNVIPDVRENLDVVPGGKHLKMISKISSDASMAEDMVGGGVGPAFADGVAQLVDEGEYDLVLIDCAPGNPELQDMALTASRYVLIPTKTDPGGWDGLRAVGPQVKKARETNPMLEYLGVVIFDHSPSASRVLKATSARLDEVSDRAPIIDKPARDKDGNLIEGKRDIAYIRHSPATAHDCRIRGQLAMELSLDAEALAKQRLTAVREFQAAKRRNKNQPTTEKSNAMANVIELPTSLAVGAGGVAEDYFDLAGEVRKRILAAENDALHIEDELVQSAAVEGN